jgi:ATP-dependent RNA helicase SUPV3L1/SUV3
VDQKALAARGLMAVGGLAVPVEQLELLDGLLRAAHQQGKGIAVSRPLMDQMGWSARDMNDILRGLDFVPATRPTGPEATSFWRRRDPVRKAAAAPPAPAPDSPFAVLASLTPAPPPRTAPQPRPKPRPRRRRRTATA